MARIRYDCYRDATVAVEALRGGTYDLRIENVAKNWATAYDTPALEAGRLVGERIEHDLPFGVQGWFSNTRREVFTDRRVREAIGLAFDFQWTNWQRFYHAYLPRRVLGEAYTPPASSGSGGLRVNLRRAVELLGEAGYGIRDGRMGETQSGEPMAFEILLDSASMERVTLPFVKNLERLGTDVDVRTLDPTQYQSRSRPLLST